MRIRKLLAGAAVTAFVGAVAAIPVSADTIIKTVQNGHLTEWIAGYNAAEYEVAKVQINGYSVDGLGKFQLQAADGSISEVWCIQADVAHSTNANYQLVVNTVSSAQLDYLAFIGRETYDDATATAIQADMWALVNAMRSGGAGAPVWWNTASNTGVTPDSPDSWASLPAFSGSYPVGLRLTSPAGSTDLDDAEGLAAQLWADANLFQGPWTIAKPNLVAPGSYRTRITSVWNAGVPGRTVNFTLPGGTTQTAVTDASGYAQITGAGTISGLLQVDAAAPGGHVEFAAPARQQLLGAATPVNIHAAQPFQEKPAMISVASDAADGDQIVTAGGIVADAVSITSLTIGNNYLLRGQLYDVDAATPIGAEVSTAFNAAATAETHGLLSAPLPAGAAGHHFVWLLFLDDVTAAVVGVSTAADPNNLAETVLVAPALSITTDAGPTVTVQRGQVATLADTVTLTGLATAFRSTAAETGSGIASLFGPYTSAAAATCAPGEAVGNVPITFAADGTVTGAALSVTPVVYQSFYSWVATVTTSQGRAITHGCGLPAETPGVISDVSADVHLRKTISGDATTWHNAQKDTIPAYAPTVVPPDLHNGSHDDGVADAGDAVPVYPSGTKISFRYAVWLDAASTGWATWATGTTGVVSDDNSTPGNTSDDFSPIYVSGDDGDGFLEPGETWLYDAKDKSTANAGDVYRNYSAIGAGRVVDGSDTQRPTGKTTTPRKDPAGYVVPSCRTTAINTADQTHLIGTAGGTIADTVSCTNLVPGVALTVSGELQARQPDGTVIPSGITGSTTFTPAAATAPVNVMFTVPATTSPGTYVVFETITEPFTGKVIADHKDATDADQTIRKRAPITVSTRACDAKIGLETGATVGAQCDIITLGGDAGDAVTGTITAYSVNSAGVRECANPGPSLTWTSTVNSSGMVVVTTDRLNLPGGDWEFIEAAHTADGRTWSRECLTAPRNAAESFKMVPAKGTPGRGIPSAGSNSAEMLQMGGGLVGAGVLTMLTGSRRRRRQTPI